MDNQNIKVEVKEGVKELTIREGKAEKVLVPQRLTIFGTISAASKYNEKRESEIKPLSANVSYSYDNMTVTLETDEKMENRTTVQGKLEISSELKKMGIYTGAGQPQIHSIKSLSQLLRFNRQFFPVLDEATQMIENLAKFKASAQTQIESEADKQGNKKGLYELKVQTNIPLSFNLEIPLFKGYEKKKFKVEICSDLRESNLDLWLESPELSELLSKESRRIIDEEIKKLERYVCIEI